MSIPSIQKVRLGSYILKQMVLDRRRFPLVLMLEPTFRCNLRCAGCGKIAHPEEVLNRRLSLEDCLQAAEECGAPVISIPGGEPLLLPDIHHIVAELIVRKKFVYLCTNALMVEKRIEDFTPSPYLTFSVHIDGVRERHDTIVGRTGVFDRAVAAIRRLKSRGFRVTTNTTFFKGQTAENAVLLCDFLAALGVEGMTISAAFHYENTRDADAFFSREETIALFRRIFQLGKGKNWPFNHSNAYLRFLAGGRDYPCSPWGNPTRNIFGWQRPCYLINDGYTATYQELLTTTDWKRYGVGSDLRCENCMVHCGYEPTAVLDVVKHPYRALRCPV